MIAPSHTAATDAGCECAWQIAGKPSWVTKQGFAQLIAQGIQLERLLSHREDAESDPAAFVAAFFHTVEQGKEDLEYEARNDFEHELHQHQRMQARMDAET